MRESQLIAPADVAGQYARYVIEADGINANSSNATYTNGTELLPFLIDSGTTLNLLPQGQYASVPQSVEVARSC